jgi:class 3 adenylate cyclase
VIVASRLSSAAEGGQILLNPRAHAAVEVIVFVEPVGELQLKGFARPIPAVNVVGYRSPGDPIDSDTELATTAADL